LKKQNGHLLVQEGALMLGGYSWKRSSAKLCVKHGDLNKMYYSSICLEEPRKTKKNSIQELVTYRISGTATFQKLPLRGYVSHLRNKNHAREADLPGTNET
jgi:hypothetical protein